MTSGLGRSGREVRSPRGLATLWAIVAHKVADPLLNLLIARSTQAISDELTA